MSDIAKFLQTMTVMPKKCGYHSVSGACWVRHAPDAIEPYNNPARLVLSSPLENKEMTHK